MENPSRVLGVLSGEDLDGALLRRWAVSAERVLAADAGADRLFDVGVVAHVVVGDMDSVSKKALDASPEAVPIADPNRTDCDKLLALATKEGHKRITLAGVEGDLPDHVLATLHSSARATLDVRLAYRRGMGWIVSPECPRKISDVPEGRRVSLLPLVSCTGANLSNVAWPIENAVLTATGMTSISNRALKGQLVATMREGAALLFVEYLPAEMPFWDA